MEAVHPGIGEILTSIHTVIQLPSASKELERILLQQQVNHKMGGRLPLGFPIAHKTGEEEDKTHDN